MMHSLTIYCALSFTPFEDSGYSCYSAYVESQANTSSAYVLMSLQLSSYFPRDNFVVITNEPYLFLTIANSYQRSLPLIQYCPFEFRTSVGTPFRLAHYKIDVWYHIAKFCPSSHACLLDLDVVGFSNPYQKLKSLINSETDIYFYDQYSIQARSYGESVILSDIALLSPNNTKKFWAAGEFLLASKSSFLSIYDAAYSVKNQYLNSLLRLRHIGDEAVLTSALISVSQFLNIQTINQYSVINRVFLARLLKSSKRQSFDDIFGFVLIHLPSSKNLLSSSFYHRIPLLFRPIFLRIYMMLCVIILRFLPCR